MPHRRTRNGTSTAADFLTRCFAPDETIALLVRRESPNKTFQRIAPLEHALAPRYLGWLAHENSIGANIYVAANPLRSGSRKRTKECIGAVRHLYLDLDTDGEACLASLRASHAVPTPTAVLSTSLGKYQILWRVDGFTLEQQESTLKLLAIGFGGDPACTDCNLVLRLPGFLNRKYDPRIASRSNTTAISPGIPATFGWILQRRIPCFCPMQCRRDNIPIRIAIPNAIGPGFCTNLPTERTPQS